MIKIKKNTQNFVMNILDTIINKNYCVINDVLELTLSTQVDTALATLYVAIQQKPLNILFLRIFFAGHRNVGDINPGGHWSLQVLTP